MTFLHNEIKTSVDGVCLLMNGQSDIPSITYKYIENIERKLTELYRYSVINNIPYAKEYDNIRRLNTIAMFCIDKHDISNAMNYYKQILSLIRSIEKNTITISGNDAYVISYKFTDDIDYKIQYYDYKVIINKFKLINELKIKLNSFVTDTNRQTVTDTNRQTVTDTNRQTGTDTNRQTGTDTNRQTVTDTNRQTGTDTNRQVLDTIILNNRIFNPKILKITKYKDAPLKLASMLRRSRR